MTQPINNRIVLISRERQHHENIDDAQEPSSEEMRGMRSSAASVICSRLTDFSAYSERLFAKLREKKLTVRYENVFSFPGRGGPISE